MEKLNREYIALLSGEGSASDRFWGLERRVRQDKRSSGVVVQMRRTMMRHNLLSLPEEQVHALKAVITPEQWRSFLPELLANCFGTPICEHLLFEEKYYDVLLTYLTQTGTPRSCMQFLTELAQEYPERTTKCFSELIAKEMESATSPKAYRTAAEYLTNLSRLPNGQAAAQELAHAWRQKWPRRRSLMNALSELGF